MGGSWEEVMSWLMAAGPANQNVITQQAGFAPTLLSPQPLVLDYFSAAVKHFAELLTAV